VTSSPEKALRGGILGDVCQLLTEMWYEILGKLTFEITPRSAWRGRRPDSIQKLFGNEVYCTNASLLLMNILLRSKLHHRFLKK
jgi:hypothetical protein